MTNLERILKVAEPVIAKGVEAYEAAMKKQGKLLTNFDVKMHEIRMQYDLVKAVGNYIMETDSLPLIGIGTRKGILCLTAVVVRNEESLHFSTNLVSAGGYNIQCFHYRYIVTSKMQKLSSNPMLEIIKAKKVRMSKEEKLKFEISAAETRYKNYLDKVYMTDEQILESVSYYWPITKFEDLNDYAKQFYKTAELFEADKKDQCEKAITRHRQRYYLKGVNRYVREINKLKTKLAALK